MKVGAIHTEQAVLINVQYSVLTTYTVGPVPATGSARVETRAHADPAWFQWVSMHEQGSIHADPIAGSGLQVHLKRIQHD